MTPDTTIDDYLGALRYRRYSRTVLFERAAGRAVLVGPAPVVAPAPSAKSTGQQRLTV